MAILDSQTAAKFGYDNMKGRPVRNVGRATQATDAQTFAAPSYTTTQRDAIPNKTVGMVLWNTTTSKLQVYNGSTWSDLH
jgi:hypothetical protein